MENKDITLEIKLSEVEIIMAGLNDLPHKISRALIDNISNQVNVQLQEDKKT